MKKIVFVLGLFLFPQEAWVSQMVPGPKLSWKKVLKQSTHVAEVEYLGVLAVKISREKSKSAPAPTSAYRFRLQRWLSGVPTPSVRGSLLPSNQYHSDIRVEGLPPDRGEPVPEGDFYVVDVTQFLLEDAFSHGRSAVESASQMTDPPLLEVGRKYVFMSSSYHTEHKYFEGGPDKSLVDIKHLEEVKRLRGSVR